MDKAIHPRASREALCADPALRDLPYKIETNEYGQIVMSPTNQRHGLCQSKIDRLLARLVRGGEPSVETAIQTSRGTKVADVTDVGTSCLSAPLP